MQAASISQVLEDATAAGIEACIGRQGYFEEPFTTAFVATIQNKGGQPIAARIHNSKTEEPHTGCDVQLDWTRPGVVQKRSCFLQIKVVYPGYRQYMDTVGKQVPNNVVTPNQPYFDLFYWSKMGPYYQVITLDKHVQKQSQQARTFGGYLLVEPIMDHTNTAVGCSVKYIDINTIKEITVLDTEHFDMTVNPELAANPLTLKDMHEERIRVAGVAYAQAQSWDNMPHYCEHY